MWHKKHPSGANGVLPSSGDPSHHQLETKVNYSDGGVEMANGLPPKPKSSVSEKEESRFGYLSWRPNWMQVFNNPKFLLVILCAITFTQSFGVSGISNVNVTTFERRFGLSSTRVGWIASSYDICAGITVLPVSYIALRVNKHRLMAVSAALLCGGAFVMWLPHILAEKYVWGDNVGVCSSDSTCSEDTENVSPYFYVLIMGQVLKSLGGTAIYSVGVSSLDDCVSTLKAPLYLGIMYAFSAIGPAVGYVLGGYFLDFYVDFETEKTIELTPEDPRWVGAWWLGYIIAMGLAFLLIFPFFGLPRDLPSAKAVKAAKLAEADDAEAKSNLGTSLKDVPRVMWMLLTNKIFVLTTLAGASESIVIVGSSTFFPKFIENQFGQTPGFSAILTGVLAVPGAAGGFILGGYLCRRYKLTMRGALRLCFACTFLSMLFGNALWMHCDGSRILAGVNVRYNDSSAELDEPQLMSGCNSGCSCDQENYAPVCDARGVQYFSSCYAGCKELDGTNYKTCSCVMSDSGANQTATKGACEITCDWLYAFLMLFFGMMLTTFINATPITVVTLRCVPVSHKTFALGVQWMIGRFLGFVPGPLLYGVIVDSACVVWKKACGTDTELSCWIYSTFDMRRNFFLLSIGIKLLSAILYITASFACKKNNRVNPEYTLTIKPPDTNVTASTADFRASVDVQRDRKPAISTIS